MPLAKGLDLDQLKDDQSIIQSSQEKIFKEQNLPNRI
jgi:hypothetical protein